MNSLDLFATDAPCFTVFRSGASSMADLRGFIRADMPIGVTAMDISAPALETLANYASAGGQVFIDSGAFRLYLHGVTVDFAAVLGIYQKVARLTDKPENLLVVGPDKVGDQAASTAMVETWAPSLNALMALGVKVMLPLQRGDASLSAVYDRYTQLLGRPFVAGLPSNAEALSEAEILQFVAESKPPVVHFLGCQVRPVFHKIIHISPGTQITADAATLRAKIGSGRALTDLHHSLRESRVEASQRGEGDDAEWDITEYWDSLDQLILVQSDLLRSLARELAVSPFKLKSVAQNGHEALIEFIDEEFGGYGQQRLDSWWGKQCFQAISPLCRSEAVSKLAQAGAL